MNYLNTWALSRICFGICLSAIYLLVFLIEGLQTFFPLSLATTKILNYANNLQSLNRRNEKVLICNA